MGVGLIQPAEGLDKNTYLHLSKREFSCLLAFTLGHHLFLIPSSKISGLPQSPDHWLTLQTVGLFIFHYHARQFLIISLLIYYYYWCACVIYMYVCIHTSMCVSVTSAMSDFEQPLDYSPLGSSIHGILQARILEWVAMPSSTIYIHTQIHIYICVYVYKIGSVSLANPNQHRETE